jgi:hypothetical protein
VPLLLPQIPYNLARARILAAPVDTRVYTHELRHGRIILYYEDKIVSCSVTVRMNCKCLCEPQDEC